MKKWNEIEVEKWTFSRVAVLSIPSGLSEMSNVVANCSVECLFNMKLNVNFVYNYLVECLFNMKLNVKFVYNYSVECLFNMK